MVKIAICDDIPGVASNIKKRLIEQKLDAEVEIDDFVSGTKLLIDTIKKRYDIILIDIELYPPEISKENGMTISNKIKDMYPEIIVIFFTGKTIYQQALLNFEPFRYITKPINMEKLVEAVNAGIRRIRHWDNKFFSFSRNKVIYRIKTNRIMYLASKRPYIEIVCVDDQFSFRGKMDDAESILCNMVDEFLRPNKSYLVNQEYIISFCSKEIVMLNGERITISRRYASDFKEKYFMTDF